MSNEPTADPTASPAAPVQPPAALAPAHAAPAPDGDATVATDGSGATPSAAAKRRRRGSRGGRNRSGRPAHAARDGSDAGDDDDDGTQADLVDDPEVLGTPDVERNPELPERESENRPKDVAAAERAVVQRPKIGDSRPAPPDRPKVGDSRPSQSTLSSSSSPPPSSSSSPGEARPGPASGRSTSEGDGTGTGTKAKRRRSGRGRGGTTNAGVTTNAGGARTSTRPIESVPYDSPIDLDDDELERRRGRERNGRPVGRYLMCVHVQRDVDADGNDRHVATQIAVLEGRALMEHYVSRPSDDVAHIHGNVYVGRVQNVLPGMEAAFVDIGTPKNAVLYRGDVHYDPEDVESGSRQPKIEDILKARQQIVCQVTKNPIAHKGARLTQEVSLPGRFVVLIPNSSTYGISKRLPDDERKRLRSVLDRVKPAQHGVIVRTAAEGVTTEELERDVARLLRQWEQIDALANRSQAPALLYREPDMAVRIIREEFNAEFRGIVIDDAELFAEVRDYVASISPALADRVEHFDPVAEALPLFERFHVHEQLHKALDRKVWLPSGGSLIIEHTEALTVIDINTGKNVGTSSLEATVFKNNLEAADEIARQLRLRDIGGIIVIDFIDMEVKANRESVISRFRDALARDKTRTQVFDISDLGLVEMTRKRIGEGLLESFASACPECAGRGVLIDHALIGE